MCQGLKRVCENPLFEGYGLRPYAGVSTFQRVRIDPNLRNARVFWSHRSDALYQGTTSVGPMRFDKELGL